mgnify:CR=1 FL=1
MPIAAAATRERGMVAKASHELRTPASVILSSAEILEREGLVKPAGRDLLRGIAEESQRLGRLSPLDGIGTREIGVYTARLEADAQELALLGKDIFAKVLALADPAPQEEHGTSHFVAIDRRGLIWADGAGFEEIGPGSRFCRIE